MKMSAFNCKLFIGNVFHLNNQRDETLLNRVQTGLTQFDPV